MSRRAPLAYTLLLAAAAAATTWCTLLSWRAFVGDTATLTFPLLLLAVLTGAIGGTGRWLRLPLAAVVAVQAAVAAMCVLGVVTGSPVPTSGTLHAFDTAYQDGLASARLYMSPVPPSVPPITPILLAAGAAGLVAVDFLAGALRRIPLSGLALLTLYSVPVTITGSGLAWWTFSAMAAGFLAMLHLVNDEQISRWGRGMSSEGDADPAALDVRPGGVRISALVIGAAATALAVALPVLIPTLELSVFDGNGPGKRNIEVVNPLVDLRRDLVRDVDIPLLLVTTPQRNPTYFRTTILTSFNGDSWTPGDRDIPDTHVARGEMPPLTGVSASTPRTETQYNVRASDDFESTWLPTTSQVSTIDVAGDWRYDSSTMDFMTTAEDTTAAGLTYSFTGVSLEPDARRMDSSVSGASQVGSSYLEVPGISPKIRTLTAVVTSGATTRFRKAQVLQEWFRKDGGFTYSLEATGDGDLDSFLAESGRVGYCQQFAASMAIMARIVGIPSRVAVGFLESRAVGPTTYEFSTHDLHAWPELFFPGAGWVRFEPTPGARAESVPSYTRVDLGPEVTAEPSPNATKSDEGKTPRGPSPSTPATAGGEGSSLRWARAVLVLLGLLVLASLTALPALLRRRRRERRLLGGIEDLWSELRDHAVDLGHSWPQGRSPRATGAWLAARFGAAESDDVGERPRCGPEQDPVATEALDRLVEQVERARYARLTDELDTDQAREDVASVEAALDHGVGPRIRRRARWWPRSLRTSDHPPTREVVTRETEDALRG